MYKFEKLEVDQMALTYTDLIYALVEKLPRVEESNLKSLILRAATSIEKGYDFSQSLFSKLQAMRRSLLKAEFKNEQ